MSKPNVEENNNEEKVLTKTDLLEVEFAKISNKRVLVALTEWDEKLREKRDCIINNDEEKCQKLGQYHHQN